MKIGVDCVGVGVGAVLINKDRKLFLAQRGKEAKNERGKWETPGGRLEFNESMAETVIREMREEYGIEVEIVDLLHTFDHIIPDENQHWVAISFLCKLVKGEPKIVEPHKCDGIGWFTLEEAEQKPLAITAKKDIEKLKKDYPDGLPNLY